MADVCGATCNSPQSDNNRRDKEEEDDEEGGRVEDTISQRSAEILMTLLNPPRFELLRLARDMESVASCNREEVTEGGGGGKVRAGRQGEEGGRGGEALKAL